MDASERGRFLLRALNVTVRGDGPTTIIFAHGFGTDQSIWNGIIPYFTNSLHRVVSYDLMGSGPCDPNNYDLNRYGSLQGHINDLLDILSALSVERCVFVGHSISAMIGLSASLLQPQLFKKLILLGASPRYTNDEGYIGGIEQAHMEEVYKKMQTNYAAWVRGFAPLAVGADLPEPIQEFSRTLFNIRPDIALHVARTAFDADLRGCLSRITVPVGIIQGAFDLSVPVSVAEYLRDNLGGPTAIEVLQVHGHLPHLSAPAIVGPAILRFLRRRIQ